MSVRGLFMMAVSSAFNTTNDSISMKRYGSVFGDKENIFKDFCSALLE